MIQMNDFKAEPLELREAMLHAARRVMESGWYVLGGEVADFEQQWASSCGSAYGAGVGSGLDALEISLRALGIGPGDEVITTPMTAFATVLAIIRTGASPVLADIYPDTALMSIESVKRCVSAATKAVMLVHLYGQVRQMDAWCEFCQDRGIHLVEDCAQAHAATWNQKVAGSFGIAGAYSFYPTKNLGALGDAGMIVTNVEEVDSCAKRLRNYGQVDRYTHTELGMNSRLDELQAAILAERMPWLPKFTERRRQIALAYRERIFNPLVNGLAAPEEPSAHVYHLYVVRCAQRDSLQEYLAKCGVNTVAHYPIPVHQQEPCVKLRRDPSGLQACEEHASTCLTLPCHPQMSDEQVGRVVEAVNAFGVS